MKWLQIMIRSFFWTGFLICSNSVYSEKLPALKRGNSMIIKPKSSVMDIAVPLHIQPGQKWFEEMKKKYPNVGLQDLKMCPVNSVDPGWCMTWNNQNGQVLYIGCPEEKYYGLKPFTAADEGALMHEIGHVRNHKNFPCFQWPNYHTWKLTALASAVAATVFVASSGYDTVKKGYLYGKIIEKYPKLSESSALGLLVSAYLIGSLTYLIKKIANPLLARADEVLADNFACQYADASALVGRYYHMCEHAKEQKMYPTFLHRWIHDFAHPASSDRAQKVKQVLHQRFGIQIPAMNTGAINAIA